MQTQHSSGQICNATYFLIKDYFVLILLDSKNHRSKIKVNTHLRNNKNRYRQQLLDNTGTAYLGRNTAEQEIEIIKLVPARTRFWGETSR